MALSRRQATALVGLLLSAVAVLASIAARPWLAELGDSAYQEFLRFEWVLLEGGEGIALDVFSLPLPPLTYLAAASVLGPTAAETWLPVLLAVGIFLVLFGLLLRGYPLPARLLGSLPMLVTPFFYLLQRQLDLQLFVLLLGVQLATLRSFRTRPTVARVTAAVGANVLLSLTSYAALVALATAVVYLLFIANYRGEVQAAAWRALLWLYVPFSLAGYLVWFVFWAVVGSRLRTSYFLASPPPAPIQLEQLVGPLANAALPLVMLLGIAGVLWVFLRAPHTRMRGGRSQAVAWVVATFISTALALLGLQAAFQIIPAQTEALTFSLVLLVPAAVASVYGQARNILRHASVMLRIALLVSLGVVVAMFPVQFALRPALSREILAPPTLRADAGRAAAAQFVDADPGGGILIDPRFAATFVIASGVDPDRLVTPFDDTFEEQVTSPRPEIRTVVVTDHRDDFVSGNHPAMRLADVLPNGVLVAEGRAGETFQRVFNHEPVVEPSTALPAPSPDPAIREQEEVILRALRAELAARGGLPLRAGDGWAYAVDVGNLMIYAAERGNIELFRSLSDVVRRHYLIQRTDDANALFTIAWRAHPDREAEASGTTETLRMAEAYWKAGERWDNDYYRRLAYVLARAYARHADVDEYNRLWYIRNYYNYETKTYATNTYLVDYNPDILRRIADGMDDPQLRTAAELSKAFVLGAQLDFGLFHEMYQPEISTLYGAMTYFSPNAITQVIDSYEAVLGITDSAPDAARRTHRFMKSEYDSISSQYTIDGSEWGPRADDPSVYAYVARLALRLNDLEFARTLIDKEMSAARVYADAEKLPANDPGWFFRWSSVLLTLGEYQDRAAAATD